MINLRIINSNLNTTWGSRKIIVNLRNSGEYPNPITDRPLSIDDINDQPDWWTSDGGEFTGSDPIDGYDP